METEVINPEGQQPQAQAAEETPIAQAPGQEQAPEPQDAPLTKAELQAILQQQGRQFQSLVDKSTFKLRQEIKAASKPYEDVLADPDISPYLGEDAAELLRKKRLEAMAKVMGQEPEKQEEPIINGLPVSRYVDIAHAHGLKDDDPDMAQIDPDLFANFQDWMNATVNLARTKSQPSKPKPTIATPAVAAPPATPVPVTVGLGTVRAPNGLGVLKEQHRAALDAGDFRKANELLREIAKLA
jgi:hypothetical protein